MQKLLSKVNSNIVYTVKTDYNLSNMDLGKILGVSPSLINNWLNLPREVSTETYVWEKVLLLYRHSDSSGFIKKLVKFLARFY